MSIPEVPVVEDTYIHEARYLAIQQKRLLPRPSPWNGLRLRMVTSR